MTRPRLVVHGHFYQPPRSDPFSGTMPLDPTAAPGRHWNERVSAESYRPNAVVGNLAAISWDLGPTLAGWMETGDPVAYRGFVDGDRGVNGMAQAFHHTILPLATPNERRTEIRWGLRDFEVRFGRRPTGMWLPETAADDATLADLLDEGVTHVILAPWQVELVDAAPDDHHAATPDTRRPVRLRLRDGRTIVAFLYDGPLSSAVSFDAAQTEDADRFVRERLLTRAAEPPTFPDGDRPLLLIATDGELYGHHQAFREHFLARLVGRTAPDELPFDLVSLSDVMARTVVDRLPTGRLRDRTSWSCHHGLDRWSIDCDCVADGTWKAPLRTALVRLADGVDEATERLYGDLPGRPDPWAVRDGFVDVVIGAASADTFARRWIGTAATAVQTVTMLDVMEAQRWRLAMFASCAWFWEHLERPETASALRAATRAARLIDALAGSTLERRLTEDLAAVVGPDGRDGQAMLATALAAVGQRPLTSV